MRGFNLPYGTYPTSYSIDLPTQLTYFTQVVRTDSYLWWFLACLRSDGRIQTWGKNTYFRLGVPDASISTWPSWLYEISPSAFDDGREVELIDQAIDVAAQEQTGCALIADGRVRCWGRHALEEGGYENTWVPWDMRYLP